MSDSLEAEKRLIPALLNLEMQGLVERTETSIRLTEKGRIESDQRWAKLSDEDRLLFGFLYHELWNRQHKV